MLHISIYIIQLTHKGLHLNIYFNFNYNHLFTLQSQVIVQMMSSNSYPHKCFGYAIDLDSWPIADATGIVTHDFWYTN